MTISFSVRKMYTDIKSETDQEGEGLYIYFNSDDSFSSSLALYLCYDYIMLEYNALGHYRNKHGPSTTKGLPETAKYAWVHFEIVINTKTGVNLYILGEEKPRLSIDLIRM